MEKIASFTIDHLKLLPGVYISRKDKVGENTITTFDIRMTRPNFDAENAHRAPAGGPAGCFYARSGCPCGKAALQCRR